MGEGPGRHGRSSVDARTWDGARFPVRRRVVVAGAAVVVTVSIVAVVAIEFNRGHPRQASTGGPPAMPSASAGPPGPATPSQPAPAASGDACVASTVSGLSLQ